MAVKKNWRDPDCALPKSAGQNKIRIIEIVSEIANIINRFWIKTIENMNSQPGYSDYRRKKNSATVFSDYRRRLIFQGF
jgi:hypothetical protein